MKKSQVLSLLLCYSFENKFSNKFVIKIDNDKYPDEIFYFKENKCFMIYHFKMDILWCKDSDFWEYFETKFNFNYKQIKYLIKFMMEKYLNLSGVMPEELMNMLTNNIEKHFNNSNI